MQNARFYEAFEQSDLETLDAVWSHSENVKCVHPGSELLEGWHAVRESWVSLFTSIFHPRISLRNVVAEIRGTTGIVTLVEELQYATEKTIHSGLLVVTNIFEYDGRDWRMIHHHASPLLQREEGEDDEKYRYN